MPNRARWWKKSDTAGAFFMCQFESSATAYIYSCFSLIMPRNILARYQRAAYPSPPTHLHSPTLSNTANWTTSRGWSFMAKKRKSITGSNIWKWKIWKSESFSCRFFVCIFFHTNLLDCPAVPHTNTPAPALVFLGFFPQCYLMWAELLSNLSRYPSSLSLSAIFLQYHFGKLQRAPF